MSIMSVVVVGTISKSDCYYVSHGLFCPSVDLMVIHGYLRSHQTQMVTVLNSGSATEYSQITRK